MPKEPEKEINKEKEKAPKIGDYVSVDRMSPEERAKRNQFMGDRKYGMFLDQIKDVARVKAFGDDPHQIFEGYKPEVTLDENLPTDVLEALQKERMKAGLFGKRNR